MEINCNFCIYHWCSQIYWSSGNFLQMISLARLVDCLKARLRDSRKEYFQIWSSTNLCFMISDLDSSQGYQMWHQEAAAVVGLYMLLIFGLLVPRWNCLYLGNSLTEFTSEIVTVDAFLYANLFMPISWVPAGVQQSDIGASQDSSKIKELWLQSLLLFPSGLKAIDRNNPKYYGF